MDTDKIYKEIRETLDDIIAKNYSVYAETQSKTVELRARCIDAALTAVRDMLPR